MARRLTFAIAGSLVAGTAAGLPGQAADGLLIGQRVRLWAPSPRIGTLTQADSARFTFVSSDSGDTVTVPRRKVRRVEVSRGLQRGTLHGARVGIAFGALIGVVVGAATYERPDCNPATDFLCLDFGPGFNILGGMAVGIVGGGLTGALIGSQTREERWNRVSRERWRVIVSPGENGMHLGLSAAF